MKMTVDSFKKQPASAALLTVATPEKPQHVESGRRIELKMFMASIPTS
jgi:hypothetical protein